MKKHGIRYRDWLDRPQRPDPAPPTEPAAAPVAGPVAEQVTEPVATPLAEPVAEPVTEPVAESVVASVTEPVSTPPARAAEAEAPAAEPVEYLLFRVARELFALPLDAVEEALDVADVQPMPEMTATMLGVMTVRGATVPLYAPAGPLGLAGDRHRAALIFGTARGRVALAVDDVDDVLVISPDEIRRSPLDFGDRVLVGVARRAQELVGILDAGALVAACRAEPALENA